jgi:hypothetical protein
VKFSKVKYGLGKKNGTMKNAILLRNYPLIKQFLKFYKNLDG